MKKPDMPSDVKRRSSRGGEIPRPVVLCILDGWGEREDGDDNAIALARAPHWSHIKAHYPHARLEASALKVGLPEGQMGNSEVGHMTLGAGRVLLQDLPRIDKAIAGGDLARHPTLVKMIATLKETGKICHLMGLLSPGGVHSYQAHIEALVKIIAGAGVKVRLHAFLDGRDTPPSSGLGYMRAFLETCADVPGVSVATVSGRYFAMDRDNRWERVEQAYRALVGAAGTPRSASALEAIGDAYDNAVTDEFVLPTVVGDYRGMDDGDAVVMANFRADRAREILTALLAPDFKGFARDRKIDLSACIAMTDYSAQLTPFYDVLFPSEAPRRILSEVVSDAGLRQLHIAETEKYAHVTFFFNGGREDPFPGEERILVPSPKVATYDLKPEMSAREVTDNILDAIRGERFDLIVANYANGDMVGHTGKLDAAIKAVETLDEVLARLERALLDVGGVMVLTADHGNCETMRDGDQPHTAHTLNSVPVVLVNGPRRVLGVHDGDLADVAPTVLDLLGLAQPVEMTGKTLIDSAPRDLDA
ncbi:2,3-bisphosphoglycerate-independent phosphoglycerate mutase [Varunaivibrio sulfuroxidans]|uniref:2,3-bisphosphoglycerate-independent phosphoglycerate mutase n=1 Tax=Varunaivibrio sulfuroxidans TaxID=1773489 RepID=A0A4R3J7J5_9PROT|nr:2,3-bisphosphoglycerate-independent phosphoglycerate mutase [Varunaivibrio sulfuroxidans]TCS60873.1 phosphoglycerate mutase [Varunaivibrio sulfuroxidans]WES31716.1 2,3-bisphosphoglycerate-independent phosphoglycerate mutase [Varunaivibrio sulfuroxidans]